MTVRMYCMLAQSEQSITPHCWGREEKLKKMDNIYIPTIALQARGRQKIGYSSVFQELWKNTG